MIYNLRECKALFLFRSVDMIKIKIIAVLISDTNKKMSKQF